MGVNHDAKDYTGLFDGRPGPKKIDQSPEQQKLAAEFREWLRKVNNYRLGMERTWALNRSYLKGDQVLARNRLTGEIVRLSSDDSKRVRSQNNVLRPTARSLTGKLCRMIPTYTVDPASADFAEQHGARTANQLIEHVRRVHNLDNVYASLCSYLNWAGNAFVQLAWNPLAGRTIAYCPICHYVSYEEEQIGGQCPSCAAQRQAEIQAQQLQAETQQARMAEQLLYQLPPEQAMSPEDAMNAAGPQQVPMQQMGPLPTNQQVPKLTDAREGDIAVYVRDPRDVFLPPGIREITQAKRFAVRTLMEVSEACAMYPEAAPYITPDAVIELERYGTYISRSVATGAIEELSDHVFVWEFHERPTNSYPKGRVVIMINEKIIQEDTEGTYYELDRLPVYHFGFDKNDDEIYCDSWITHAWHRQRELNLTETQIREAVDLTLRPHLLNPIGSRVAEEEISATSAQIISYNSAVPEPKWLQTPPVPQGLWDRKADLMQDIRLFAGITEAQQGMSVNDPNGRAMAILNAETDQQIGPIMRRNNAEWRALYKGILVLYQKFAHPDRVALVAGPEGYASIYFKDLNLRPGFDLRMEEEDSLSHNPAVRLTQGLDLAQIGFFVDPMTGALDKKGFARYVGLKVPDRGADQEATERAAAAQIPYLIMEGKQYFPRQFDVPQIFAEELEAWLRGPGRQADQELSQTVEMIWQFYKAWAMSGMMPPMGGPSGQGGPGQGGGSQPGNDASAPGGTPNNPGRLGTDLAAGAQEQVAQADAVGEQAAQTTMNHEG